MLLFVWLVMQFSIRPVKVLGPFALSHEEIVERRKLLLTRDQSVRGGKIPLILSKRLVKQLPFKSAQNSLINP